MPLDEYKTQVLLLHSEQRTLDNLSSGFSDRYTVHCATSGSEALNTLVETPINVIVTAQDLPGMSGLEALREARKRSPGTIGILLAGNAAGNVEALVGDEELFQVVRGQVSSDMLLKLVDNATRQIRLMALAESANDTTANVDEPAQHIIMETSENGSTIITDATGRMPALNPDKVSAAASVGSKSVDILVLTKDEEFLQTIKDSSRGMHKVYYANTLSQATEAIGKHKIGVAVVDASMVGEKAEQLTQHLRKGSPRLVSIVAGRRDDGEMLMDLINRGKVYRFLLKPVSPGRARLAVESSVKHHLEAPDSAFKLKGTPAAAATPASKAAAAARTPAAPKPKPKPAIVAKPAPPKSGLKPAPTARKVADNGARPPADPPLGREAVSVDNSLANDRLGDAFGDNDSSFAETVTGLISSITGRKDAGKESVPQENAPRAQPTIVDSTSGSGSWVKTNARYIGIGTAAAVLVSVAAYWLMGDADEAAVTSPEIVGTPPASNNPMPREAVAADTQADVTALIEEARLAREAGQLFNPAGSNAIELFAAALARDPGNATVELELELDAAVDAALGMAETALLESRLDDADAAVTRVTLVDAENSRLPFLTAQLSQMQLRARLDDARLAIRESRFEDAASALGAANKLDVADRAGIDVVTAELAAARSEQRVDDVLAQAAAKLDAGDLISPANDNARYYYELVLSNDAENTIARQGLGLVAGKLAFMARAELDNGDLNAAEDILADARAVDANNTEVESTVTALANARFEAAERQRKAEAQAQADRDAAAEQRAQAASDAAAAEARAAAQREADKRAAAQREVEAQKMAAEPATDGVAAEPGTSIDEPEASTTTAMPVSAAPTETAQQQPVADDRPVAISSLTRTRYVAPKYPRAAERRNLSGWVDVMFTVAVDGSVSNIEVLKSEPGDIFVGAATKAVEKWEFEAVTENGKLVEKRAGVRLMFALE